jgi:hypothetical protein
MAFLDNSGDIILDAVLTDLGRKRMSEGTFRITQFALGDDEIDYRLYNKDHPSGSAYYDLQILQTPILEAFATTNANINYGLVSFNGNLNLLYLPTMDLIDKEIPAKGVANLQSTGSYYYIGTNKDTVSALSTAFNLNGKGGTNFRSGPGDERGILIETGIHSTSGNPQRTTDLSNQEGFLEANNLIDSNLNVSADSRFIRTIATINPATSKFRLTSNGAADISMTISTGVQLANSQALGVKFFKTAIIPTIISQIAAVNDNAKNANTDSEYSMINGPPGVVTMIYPAPEQDLSTASAKYSLYGKVSQNLFGDGNTYDYIDTTIYVVGKTTGVQVQIPVRIIRKVV